MGHWGNPRWALGAVDGDFAVQDFAWQRLAPEGGIWPAVQGGPGGGQPAGHATATLLKIIEQAHGEEITSPNALYIATPALLSFYGLQPSQIGAEADIITSRAGLTDLQIFDPAKGGPGNATQPDTVTPHFQIDRRLPGYTSAPDLLITAHAIQSLGL